MGRAVPGQGGAPSSHTKHREWDVQHRDREVLPLATCSTGSGMCSTGTGVCSATAMSSARTQHRESDTRGCVPIRAYKSIVSWKKFNHMIVGVDFDRKLPVLQAI